MRLSRFKRITGDDWFSAITFSFAASIPLLLFLLICLLIIKSSLGFKTFGFGFIVSSSWDPLNDVYGALPFIYGTIISSLIALAIAVPLGLGCAIFLAEVTQSKVKEQVATMIDMLAAIPSVVYGLWGIFVLSPFLGGPSLLVGGVILSIMILPTITAISREVFQAVPHSLRESALALGATKWETFKLAVFGPALSGLVGAIILGLGRALGETMAVTMVIGNRANISPSLFAPAYTLASVIANEFAEATSEVNLAVLVELGLILLVITVIVNGAARFFVWKTTGHKA